MFQSIGWILIESWPSVHLPIPGYVNTEREVEHIKDQCKQLSASFQVKSKERKPESILWGSGQPEPWQADNDDPLRHAKLVSVQ